MLSGAEQEGLEVPPQVRRLFLSVDTDNNGTLSRDEIATLMSREGFKVDPNYLTAALDAYFALQEMVLFFSPLNLHHS